MKKRLKIVIVGLLILIIAAILIIGNYFYNQSVKRGTEIELHKEVVVDEVLGSAESQEVLKRAKEWYVLQRLDKITINAYDELLLQADFIESATDNKKAVILVHGFRKTKEDMGDYTKFYHDLGYDILMPDLRGHGESEGDYYGFGWHDRLDMVEWINLLVEMYGMEEVILHGNSLGAATVLMTSGEELPDEVKGIVADSGYSTMKEELAHQLKNIYGLPGFPLLDITSVITKVRAGYFFGEASVMKQVKKNKVPLLIVHGDADDLVPTWMGEEIYAAATGEKQLWIVPDAGHIKAYEYETVEFEERLSDFLINLQ